MSFDLGMLNPFKPIVDKTLGIIDKAVPDKDLRMKLKHDISTMNLEVETKKLEADVKDRDSARDRQVRMKDWTPNIIAGVYITGYFIVMYVILTGQITIPENNKDIVYMLMGALTAGLAQILNYFFGSSSGSKLKTHALSSAMQKKK